MNKHRNGKTDQQGNQNSTQAQIAQVGRNVAQGGSRFPAGKRTASRLFILVLTLFCVGSISFISWIMLVVRDPFVTFLLYVPVFVILLPMVIVSCIRLKSWGARAYCLIFFAIVMLWSTGLTAIIRTSPTTRLDIILGKYDSCKESGIVWSNNNRLALCGDTDDTWFNYLVETTVVYDSSGEIARKADQRSPAWNSAIIKVSRLEALRFYAEKYAGKKMGIRPEANSPDIQAGWGMFAENDHTVNTDFRAEHIYGNFYLINFPVSPEDLAAIL